jgi:hypothetical protein
MRSAGSAEFTCFQVVFGFLAKPELAGTSAARPMYMSCGRKS